MESIGRYCCAALVVERIEYYQIHGLGVLIKKELAFLMIPYTSSGKYFLYSGI